MANTQSRNGSLKFEAVPFEQFRLLVANQAKSSEIGPVGSQYLEELEAKSLYVGTLGLFACEKLVGALSYGVHPIRNNQKQIAARLDVVVTREECRHLGIGGLLVSQLYHSLLEEYPDTLVDISTIAAHPSVARHIETLGFETCQVFSDEPRYSINCDSPESKQQLSKKTKKDIQEREGHLKLKCLECLSRNWGRPWCCPEETGPQTDSAPTVTNCTGLVTLQVPQPDR